MLDNLKKMKKEKLEETKAIFNMLADKVETITPFLVENILKNDKSGTVRYSFTVWNSHPLPLAGFTALPAIYCVF